MAFGVVFAEMDNSRVLFEAMVHRAGAGHAKRAFARALNHTGRKATTATRRALRDQTSIKTGAIRAQTRFHPAATSRLIAALIGSSGDRSTHFSLSHFNPRQFKYGVRVKVWGRYQRLDGAFIVKSLSDNVFRNTGGWNAKARRNNAIEKLWGPSIPRELIKGQSVAAWEDHLPTLADRAEHELRHILRVR